MGEQWRSDGPSATKERAEGTLRGGGMAASRLTLGVAGADGVPRGGGGGGAGSPKMGNA